MFGDMSPFDLDYWKDWTNWNRFDIVELIEDIILVDAQQHYQ